MNDNANQQGVVTRSVVAGIVAFSGHRVDKPGKTEPRFPDCQTAKAARAIAEALHPLPAAGVSSGANGGDILFLEACKAAGVPFHIVLPFTPEEFVASSVATEAPGDWEARFHTLWQSTPAPRRHVLDVARGSTPYRACNIAILDIARSLERDPA